MNPGRAPKGADEVGQAVASFSTYEAAQKSVSKLIAAEIPARDISIVGQSLRSIERITGRLGYATAARSGAVNGVLLGLLFSAILVIGTPSVPIQAFVGVVFVGIAIGMLLSIVTYSFVRRRRDFASVMQVIADHYEVTVADASVHRARQVLGHQAVVTDRSAGFSAPSQPAPESTTPRDEADAPPRYGERITPPPGAAPGPQPAAHSRDTDGSGTDGSDTDGSGTDGSDTEEQPKP